MPKATKITTRRRYGNSEGFSDGQANFGLLAPDMAPSLADNPHVCVSCEIKEEKKASGEERRGAQNPPKEPKHDNICNKKGGVRNSVRFSGNQTNLIDAPDKDLPAPVKRQDRKGTDGKVGVSRVKERRGENPSWGTREVVGRSEEKIRIDPKSLPMCSFEASSSMMSPKHVDFGPIDNGTFDTCEIVIDRKRYKVSKWSVVDGMYVQGLDSVFLVKCYHPGQR